MWCRSSEWLNLIQLLHPACPSVLQQHDGGGQSWKTQHLSRWGESSAWTWLTALILDWQEVNSGVHCRDVIFTPIRAPDIYTECDFSLSPHRKWEKRSVCKWREGILWIYRKVWLQFRITRAVKMCLSFARFLLLGFWSHFEVSDQTNVNIRQITWLNSKRRF